LAWRIAEWQLAIFCASEWGWPRDVRAAIGKLPQGGPTGVQLAAFNNLVEGSLSLSRHVCSPVREHAGRGLQVLRKWIEEFELAGEAAADGVYDFKPETLSAVAKPVDVARIAIVNPAGTVQPEDWLTPSEGDMFLDYRRRREDTGYVDPPKGCFMVSRAQELRLRRLLLESKMAVLVEESSVPRRPDGSLLLAGMFTVAHKPDRDRLIFDRRPQNFGDHRLAWASLPLGSQLCQVVLEHDEILRGSGDDLRTYFYALSNTPDALL